MLPIFSRILVVDDSAVARRIYTHMLTRLGYGNVDEATDGRMALEMLTARRHRLVISDWRMQPMNGLELLAAMQKNVHLMDVPIIITTGRAVKFAEVARQDDSIHYLIKPFTIAALAEKLRIVTEPAPRRLSA